MSEGFSDIGHMWSSLLLSLAATMCTKISLSRLERIQSPFSVFPSCIAEFLRFRFDSGPSDTSDSVSPKLERSTKERARVIYPTIEVQFLSLWEVTVSSGLPTLIPF